MRHTRRNAVRKKTTASIIQFPIAKPLILYIEDDLNCLRLRRTLLQREGYSVIAASTTQEAIETLREAPVCCTIADHMLRGEGGAEVAAEMKRIKPDVPVVLYSGTTPERMQGVDVYISQGEPTMRLLRILKDVIQRYCS